MQKRTPFLLNVVCYAALAISAVALAAEKPEITRHDARHLDRGAVVFNVEWQSPNPVAVVYAFFGKYKKEVKIDEYDNRRNRNGYAGETTVEFSLPPDIYPEAVSYILQIEDDTHRRSEQFTGKVSLLPTAKKRKPDSFGREDLDAAAAGVVPKPQVGFGLQQQTQGGSPGSAAGPDASPGTSTSEPSGDEIPPEGAPPPPGSPSPYGHGQQPGQQQVPAYGSPQGGPLIEYIQPQQIRTGESVISFHVREERGLRDINFTIYDTNNNIAFQQIVRNPQTGPVWQGQSPPFVLPPGWYKVTAQVNGLDGSSSQKEIGNYEVKLVGQDAPSPGSPASKAE